jgi:hypothetical protein
MGSAGIEDPTRHGFWELDEPGRLPNRAGCLGTKPRQALPLRLRNRVRSGVEWQSARNPSHLASTAQSERVLAW